MDAAKASSSAPSSATRPTGVRTSPLRASAPPSNRASPASGRTTSTCCCFTARPIRLCEPRRHRSSASSNSSGPKDSSGTFGISLDQDTNEELDEAAASGAAVIEVRFNALHQEPVPAMERAAELGVGIIVKVPLESGWLSGRYHADSVFDDVRRRWTADEVARRAPLASAFARLLPADVSPTVGALRFVLAHSAVSTVIPGAKSVSQLRENLSAADACMDAETVTAIRELWREEIAAEPFTW